MVLERAGRRWAKRAAAIMVMAVAMSSAIAYAHRDHQGAAAAAGVVVKADAGSTKTPVPAVPAPTASTPPSPTAAVAYRPDGVPVLVASAVAAAGGDTAVAVFDATNGRSYAFNDSPRFKTGSVVKLSILGELLRREQGGRALTAADRRNALAMIAHSSNDAASRLWAVVGRGSAVVGTFDRLVGTKQTTADSGGYLGLTVSTALDQVQVMKAFAYPSAVLSDASRAQATDLFGQVQADQRFGATAGVPAGVRVDVKNGWLPQDKGWYVNTVAHVYGQGRDYVVAVMSKGGATENAGITRIEAVSAAVWQTAGVTR
jgi:hypothetical protein